MKKSSNILSKAGAVLVLAFWCHPATAFMIEFDEFEEPGTFFTLHPNPVDVGDFRFTAFDGSGGGVPITFQQSASLYNGSAALSCTNGSDLELTRVDGGAFSVASLEVDAVFGSAAAFEFIGQLSGGGTVQQVFDSDNGLGNQVVMLFGFTSITSLNVGVVGGSLGLANAGTIDNLDISNAVPSIDGVGLLALSALLVGAGVFSIRQAGFHPAR